MSTAEHRAGSPRGELEAEWFRRVPFWVTVAVLALMVLSAALPHVAVSGQPGGRWIVPAAHYFLAVEAYRIPSGDQPGVALGVNTVYLGLGFQQLALVLGAVTVWVLGAEDMNRWIYRGAVITGWLLAASGMLVVTGYGVMSRAGAPVELGWAWFPTLLAGLGIIILGRLSTERIDRTWYVTRPELQ